MYLCLFVISGSGGGGGFGSTDSSFGSGWAASGSSAGGGGGSGGSAFGSTGTTTAANPWGSSSAPSSSGGSGWQTNGFGNVSSSGGGGGGTWESNGGGSSSSSSSSSTFGSAGGMWGAQSTGQKDSGNLWGSSSGGGSGGGMWGSDTKSSGGFGDFGGGGSTNNSSNGWGSSSSGSSSSSSSFASWGSSGGGSGSASSAWNSDSSKKKPEGWGWGSSTQSSTKSWESGTSGGYGSGSSSSGSARTSSGGWGRNWTTSGSAPKEYGSFGSGTSSQQRRDETAHPRFATHNLNPFQIDLSLGMKAMADPKKLGELTAGARRANASTSAAKTTLATSYRRNWSTVPLQRRVVRLAPVKPLVQRQPRIPAAGILPLVRTQQRSRASLVARNLTSIPMPTARAGSTTMMFSSQLPYAMSTRRSRMPPELAISHGPSPLDQSEIDALARMRFEVKPLKIRGRRGSGSDGDSGTVAGAADDYSSRSVDGGSPDSRGARFATPAAAAAAAAATASPTPATATATAQGTGDAPLHSQQKKDSKRERTFVNPYPILKRRDYFTVPSMEILNAMTEEELMNVVDFTVGHYEYGELQWPGVTDVRGLDLDKLVVFKRHVVQVYDDSLVGSPDTDGLPYAKPPQGCELNKDTIVSLLGLWPEGSDGGGLRGADGDTTRLDPPPPLTAEALKKFEGELKASVESKHGMEYVSYKVEEGELTFRVNHWTIYGIVPPRRKGETATVSMLPSLPTDEIVAEQLRQPAKPSYVLVSPVPDTSEPPRRSGIPDTGSRLDFSHIGPSVLSSATTAAAAAAASLQTNRMR